MSNRTKLDRKQQRDLNQLQRETVARRRANAEPFPGPLAATFVDDPPQLHGLTIRPVVAGDFILLRKLDSPLYRQTAALAEHQQKLKSGQLPKGSAPPQTQYEEEEVYEMIHQFTVPVEQARAELAQGRAAFRELAMRAIADRLSITEIPALVTAVTANFLAAFDTAVKYQPHKEGEGRDATDFPPTPAARRTGSAGGSTTSAASPTAIPPARNS